MTREQVSSLPGPSTIELSPAAEFQAMTWEPARRALRRNEEDSVIAVLQAH